MSLGRSRQQQRSMWLSYDQFPQSKGHVFYERLQKILHQHGFDTHVENLGRRSIPPGRYFRMLLIGYFEGIDSERAICWRCSDSLSLREFLGLAPAEAVPDHSSLCRTRMAYKPEHVVDLESGAIVTAVVHAADQGDTKAIATTLEDAQAKLCAIKDKEDAPCIDEPFDLVADKGYHSREVLKHLPESCCSRISEPGRKGPLRWRGDTAARDAVRGNRARLQSAKSKALLRARGERVERSFAHCLDQGGMRRSCLRGLENIEKRYIIHLAGFNLGVLLRALFGFGTPKGLADARAGLIFARIGELNLLILAIWLPDEAETSALPVIISLRWSAWTQLHNQSSLLRHIQKTGLFNGLLEVVSK